MTGFFKINFPIYFDRGKRAKLNPFHFFKKEIVSFEHEILNQSEIIKKSGRLRVASKIITFGP
jgi:hypothetical protein